MGRVVRRLPLQRTQLRRPIDRRAIGDQVDSGSIPTPRHQEHKGDRADAWVYLYLLVDRETVQFNPDSDAWVDVAAFADLTGGARGETGTDSLALADLSSLEQAVALYRGPFLEGLSLPDSAAYEEWLLAMREHWQRTVMQALRRLSAHWEQRVSVSLESA